jgi:hypothetical protein
MAQMDLLQIMYLDKDFQEVIQAIQLQGQMIIIQAAAVVLEEEVLVVQVMLALMELEETEVQARFIQP